MNISKIFIVSLVFVISTQSLFANEHGNIMFEKKWTLLGSIKSNHFFKTFENLSELNIDIAGVNIDKKQIDILITNEDFIHLQNNGIDVEVKQAKGISKGPDQEYKTPQEIEDLLNYYSNLYPQLTKLVSIGKSVEGRDIWAIKISDNPELDELDEPAVLFNSMHHAREVMTPEVSLDIIEVLLTTYDSDTKTKNWVDNNVIWVIPMFNVDGNNKMWNRDSWWRKNNRGGYGVDLNRNYPTGWNSCNGSSGWRSSQTYRGPKPGSEPETQAMMDFISTVRPVFDISYHSYSELVLYPFGCSPERTQTKDIVETIGKEIAKKINYKPGTPWELLYNADGGDIDWMYEAYQVIPYVIELNSSNEGFHPRYAKWRDITVKRNRAGWMHLLDRLSKSGVRGQVRFENNILSQFTVDVYKLGAKKILYHQYNGHRTGMYHIVLSPGEYELVFKSGGKVIKKLNHTIGNNLETLNVN